MVGNARKKVDSQTMQMFDPEVDKPEHDAVLVNLFQNEAAIVSLLTELHGLEPLEPFTQQSLFATGAPYAPGSNQVVPFNRAVDLTGVEPSWESNSPIRLSHKSIEVLMNYSSDSAGRYSRLIGFMDIGVSYQVMTMPYIELSASTNRYHWAAENLHYCALFEVKSAWPTSGNLIRQLNLYKKSIPSGFHVSIGASYKHLLVGPDETVNDLANQHGYRVVTFDASGERFNLVPGVTAQPNKANIPGRF